MAQPFDDRTFTLTGDAVPIAERVQYNPARSRGIFSASRSGVLIYQSGEAREIEAGLFDRTGNRTALLSERGMVRASVSPDGKKIAFDRADPQTGRSDIWVYDIARKFSSRLTFDPASDIVPLWSPKGDSIVFSSNRSGRAALYIKNADGTGEEHLIAASSGDIYATSWSNDGKVVSVAKFGDPKTKIDLLTLPMSGTRTLVPFLQTEFNEWIGRYSPDGRWLVYQSDETGKNEIYVRSSDGSGGKWQISAGGGTTAYWLSDGKRILYVSLDRKLIVAHVSAGGAGVIVDSLSTQFDFESKGIAGGNLLGTSADGGMLVARVQESRGVLAPITLELNWERDLDKP
jgi:Tol biopolymer transport system component